MLEIVGPDNQRITWFEDRPRDLLNKIEQLKIEYEEYIQFDRNIRPNYKDCSVLVCKEGIKLIVNKYYNNYKVYCGNWLLRDWKPLEM